MNSLLFTAVTEPAHQESNPGLLSALGIDGTLLLLQSLAFLVLVFILGKFVYPHLIKAIEARRDTLEEGARSAKKAAEELERVEQKVAEILRTARSEANEIVARGQKEATNVIETAEEKAIKRAEHIVVEAKAQMTNELNVAREALKKDTAELVALATEKIIREKLDANKDARLIETTLKETDS